MKKSALVFMMVAIAMPAIAQRKFDLILDAEGIRRTGGNEGFTPNQISFDPNFDTGFGIGGGVDYYLSDRVSLEAKVTALLSNLRVRFMGSDFVGTVDLGEEQIYPIMAMLKWRLNEKGALRPYLGAGAAHIILRSIDEQIGPATGIEFENPTGLLLGGGIQIPFSNRWSLSADARYVAIETQSTALFIGTGSEVELKLRPLIVAFGIAYHF